MKFCKTSHITSSYLLRPSRHLKPFITHPINMSGLNKFFNTVSLPQKVAAWGVAGAVFGTWTWFEQRDNGKILTAAEVHERNMKIKKERKSNKQ